MKQEGKETKEKGERRMKQGGMETKEERGRRRRMKEKNNEAREDDWKERKAEKREDPMKSRPRRVVVPGFGGVGSRKGRAPRSGRTARRPQPQPAKQQPFATLTLTYGADLYTISKLLVHANVKTTQIYAKIVNENKRKAVNLILV